MSIEKQFKQLEKNHKETNDLYFLIGQYESLTLLTDAVKVLIDNYKDITKKDLQTLLDLNKKKRDEIHNKIMKYKR